MRTPEQMYEDIITWEMDAGESFVDYFDGNMNEISYLFWCLGKGYATQEQVDAYANSDRKFISNNDIVFGQDEYSIVQEPEYSYDTREVFEEAYEKAMRILAEFLSSTNTYQRRVQEFLEENKEWD